MKSFEKEMKKVAHKEAWEKIKQGMKTDSVT